MTNTLYHYVHCPFCIRVRLALGFLNQEYKSVVVSYDDETTPLKLTGKKMLPILEYPGGAMNESLDIITFIDINKKLTQPVDKELEAKLSTLGSDIHSLAMPYWIWTPEFDEKSRNYFQKKKEEKRGPFKALVKKQHQFINNLKSEWPKIENDLKPFYKSSQMGLNDILLASHLWGLYVVPEFQFPEKIHNYLQSVKDICHFQYHSDFWK